MVDLCGEEWEQFPAFADRSAMLPLGPDCHCDLRHEDGTPEPHPLGSPGCLGHRPKTASGRWPYSSVSPEQKNGLCPDCGCASSVAKGCRSDWHAKPGKFEMAARSVRYPNAHVLDEFEEWAMGAGRWVVFPNATTSLTFPLELTVPGIVRELAGYEPPDAAVDRTFENEVRLNPRKTEDWIF